MPSSIEEIGGLGGGDKLRSFLEATENAPLRLQQQDAYTILSNRALVVPADFEVAAGGALELSSDAILEIT